MAGDDSRDEQGQPEQRNGKGLDSDRERSPESGGGGSYASPPCFMHELEELAGSGPVDPAQKADVTRWRRAERERLIALRLALGSEARRRHDKVIAAALEESLGPATGLIVSAYWPFRGEPDLRPFLERVIAGGGLVALPVVIARATPLVFRAWKPGEPLRPGVWNIPTPEPSAEAVIPDVVIAPLVGFDEESYRLGYGGGFFDRTLAALPKKPRVFGVGYQALRIPTIYPQPHDIPMDLVVTETGLDPRRL